MAGMELHFNVKSGDFEITDVAYTGSESMQIDAFFDNSASQTGYIFVERGKLAHTVSEITRYLIFS
jgi:hypothetical protein